MAYCRGPWGRFANTAHHPASPPLPVNQRAPVSYFRDVVNRVRLTASDHGLACTPSLVQVSDWGRPDAVSISMHPVASAPPLYYQPQQSYQPPFHSPQQQQYQPQQYQSQYHQQPYQASAQPHQSYGTSQHYAAVPARGVVAADSSDWKGGVCCALLLALGGVGASAAAVALSTWLTVRLGVHPLLSRRLSPVACCLSLPLFVCLFVFPYAYNRARVALSPAVAVAVVAVVGLLCYCWA